MSTTTPGPADDGRDTADIAGLLGRIDALESLLVCYRIGKRPSERLFDRLKRTEADEKRIREANGFEV